MTRLTKKQLLFNLSMQIEACGRCPYSSVRKNPIVGNGECRSPILIIGPSARERDDRDGNAFDGRAKNKINRMLARAGLNEAQVYQTYLIRCYPGREPNFGEFAAFNRCRMHTIQLMRVMKPIAVVICGLKAFKWMIIKWTREIVDKHTFYKWIGKSVRLKEIWGEIKFFIIESPAELSKARNPEAEAKSIEILSMMKDHVSALQCGEPTALEMVDLKRRAHTRVDQQRFSWD